MRRWIGVCIVLFACGAGSPASPQDECARDPDCDDGVSCTRDACVPSVGGVRTCLHEPRDDLCALGEKCLVGVPNVAGCGAEAEIACLGQADGAACDVSDLCRAGRGTCRGGRCEYPTKSCPDQPCRPSLGCDPATGDCRYEVLADGSNCVLPADPCRPARCREGECEPTGAPLCDDGNSCTQDICHINVCEHRDHLDGTACDDGDPCTEGESCSQGVCGGGSARVCDDHNDCTADSCDPQNGGCVSEALEEGAPCFAGGDRCRPGTCQAGTCGGVTTLVCDDQDPCTRDSCDPTHGCRTEPLSNVPCDDGDACTKGDVCSAGLCQPGATVVCTDEDLCTTDSCDPAKGCVFTPIAPCCGNRVVEAGESCDGGPLGSEGCGPDCRYRVATLAAPPAGGRFSSVAWSVTDGSGLVAYEAAPWNRALAVRRVGADLSVGPERLVWNYQVTQVHDLTLVATPAGPADYLAVVSRPIGIDLFALDVDGGVVDKRIEAWTLWGVDIKPGRVRVGSPGPGRFLVAWQDKAFCPGSNGVPVVRVGEADLAQGGILPAVQVGAGLCDPWSPALLGEGCGVEGAGLFTLAERVTQVPGAGSVVRHEVLTFDSAGAGSPVVVAEFQGDVATPAACAAAANGQAFLLIFWEPDAVTGGIRVRSVVTGRDGGIVGGPWTLQEVGPSDGGTTPLCLPMLGAGTGLVDGRYLVLCAMVELDEDGDFLDSSLQWRLLGPDGKPAGEFTPLWVQEKAWAFDVRMVVGPRGDVLAAWYETDVFDDTTGWGATPGWLRLFALGSGTVW